MSFTSASLSRRGFLELLVAAAAAPLSAHAQTSAAGARSAVRAAGPVRAKSCVLLFMEGGASHLDTWDPKPGRPVAAGARAINTATPGLQISEFLPMLAARSQKLAVVRSMKSPEGNHSRARHLMHTTYSPQPGLDPASVGSLMYHSLAANAALPGYVSLGGAGGGAGFLGPAWGPLVVPDPNKPIFTPPGDAAGDAMDDKVQLWRKLEQLESITRPTQVAEAHRAIVERAVGLMGAPQARAFDPAQATPADRERYGSTPLGDECLMARRLVEAGVPFIEVRQAGWDTHQDNAGRVKTLSTALDPAMSGLLDDLSASGLLNSTIVIWLGDFGRTPEINGDGGRDHHPQAWSAVLAGGGIRGGKVLGSTDADGREVVERPVAVADLWRTVAQQVGLDPDEQITSRSGRPMTVMDKGQVIRELLS